MKPAGKLILLLTGVMVAVICLILLFAQAPDPGGMTKTFVTKPALSINFLGKSPISRAGRMA